MPILVVCNSCAARLRVGEHLLGQRVKCASCGKATVAAPSEPETGIAEVKPFTPNVAAEEPRPRTQPPPVPEDKGYDSVDEDELPGDRPRKKKKKRKAKRSRPFEIDSKALFLFGGSGVLAIEFFLLVGIVVAPHNGIRFLMAYFFAMVPISTIIFAGSVSAISVFGTTDLDEFPQIVVKGFFVALVVNVVALFPFGIIIAVFVWAAGIFWIFHVEGCDVWIVRILVGINWFLNLIAQLIIVSNLEWLFPLPFD